LFVNFKEILSCAHGNFEELNKVLESSIIIINSCMIFINACYIINAEYNYNISIKGLFEECYKEENVEVTGAATASCSKTQL
jgi:hypothetical protein